MKLCLLLSLFLAMCPAFRIGNINGQAPDSCSIPLVPNPVAQGGAICSVEQELPVTVSLLFLLGVSATLQVQGSDLPAGLVLGIPDPTFATTCRVQYTIAASTVNTTMALFMTPPEWSNTSYEGAGPVNLCWSDASHSGNWAYTGLKWQVVQPCNENCACCSGSGVSQCITTAAPTCCAGALLPVDQYCCDSDKHIASQQLGPTRFTAPSIIQYQQAFTVTIYGCGLSPSDPYNFIPADDTHSCSSLSSAPLPQVQPSIVSSQLVYNGLTLDPGTYNLCYGFRGVRTKLSGALQVAGPASYTTNPSPPIADRPFDITIQGVNLSTVDQIFWITGSNGDCTAASFVKVSPSALGSSTTSITVPSNTLSLGTFTLCYLYWGTVVQLEPRFTVYPAPSIAGVFQPTLRNVNGALFASTCLVAQSGYHPLVSGAVQFRSITDTLQSNVVFANEVPTSVQRVPSYNVLQPVYGCALWPIPASRRGTCYQFSWAQAIDAGGNRAYLMGSGNFTFTNDTGRSTGNDTSGNGTLKGVSPLPSSSPISSPSPPLTLWDPTAFCVRDIRAPNLEQFVFNPDHVVLDTQSPNVVALITVSDADGGFQGGTGMLQGPGGVSQLFTFSSASTTDNISRISLPIAFAQSTASGYYNLSVVTVQDKDSNYRSYDRNGLRAVPRSVIDILLCRQTEKICAPYVCPGCTNGECLIRDTGNVCKCAANYQSTSPATPCNQCVSLFTGLGCKQLNTDPAVTTHYIPDGTTLDFGSIPQVLPNVVLATVAGPMGTSIKASGPVTFSGNLDISNPTTFTMAQFTAIQLFASAPFTLLGMGTALAVNNANFNPHARCLGTGNLLLGGVQVITGMVYLQCPTSMGSTASLMMSEGSTLHIASPSQLLGNASLEDNSCVVVYSNVTLQSFVVTGSTGSMKFVSGLSNAFQGTFKSAVAVGKLYESPVDGILFQASGTSPVLSVSGGNRFTSLAVQDGTLIASCNAPSTFARLSLAHPATLIIQNVGIGLLSTNQTGDFRTFNFPALRYDPIPSPETSYTITTPIPDAGPAVTLPINTGKVTFVRVDVEVSITHTYVTDLVVRLIAPDQTSIVLFTRTSTTGKDLLANFSDTSNTSVASVPMAQLSQGITLHPVDDLATIKSPQPAGTWSLVVQDISKGDSGSVNYWKLHFITAANAASGVAFNGTLVLYSSTSYRPQMNDTFILIHSSTATGGFEQIVHNFGEEWLVYVRSYAPDLIVQLYKEEVTATPTVTPSFYTVKEPMSPAEELALAVGIAMISSVALTGFVVLIMWHSRLMTNGIDSLVRWYPSRYLGTEDGQLLPHCAVQDEEEQLPEDLSLPVPRIPPSLATFRPSGMDTSSISSLDDDNDQIPLRSHDTATGERMLSVAERGTPLTPAGMFESLDRRGSLPRDTSSMVRLSPTDGPSAGDWSSSRPRHSSRPRISSRTG